MLTVLYTLIQISFSKLQKVKDHSTHFSKEETKLREAKWLAQGIMNLSFEPQSV